MRLLIVDDEYYTRQGIVNDLDLRRVGIEEVAEADDGLNALEVARSFAPDIVLADVRMPRMDGVAMSHELRKAFPRCRLVFMSGHADKEYLKAAIEVGALRYIEKPFRNEELRDVLAEAVSQVRAEAERERRETDLRTRAAVGDPLLRAQIASMLIEERPDPGTLAQALEAASLTALLHTTNVVALLGSETGRFPADSAWKARFSQALDLALSQTALAGMAAHLSTERVVIVLYPRSGRSRAPGERGVAVLIERLFAVLSYPGLLAGVGDPGAGQAGVHTSFLTATGALQRAFFLEAGRLCTGAAAKTAIHAPVSDVDELQGHLDHEDGPAAAAHVRSICARWRAADSCDVSGARDHITRLLHRLLAYAERRGIDPYVPPESERALGEQVERVGSLRALEALLVGHIDLVFERLSERGEVGRLVGAMKHAIHREYARSTLGLADIAACARVSEAHACRLFKEQTGQTIHTYVVGYRLARAKELLADPRLPKMTDVAERTGFSDAGYFARVFRRAVGMTPSEYRERRLS
jgi:two-component system response regulator YesN